MNFHPAVGVVYLQDLLSRHVWMKDELPALLEAAGLVLEEEEVASFSPPSELVVICSTPYAGLLARYRAWLAEAETLRVVISFHGERELWDDPEYRQLVEEEVRESLGDLEPREVLWTRDIRESEFLSRLLRPDVRSVQPSSPPPWSPGDEFSSGPWCPLDKHEFLDNNAFWPSLVCVRHGVPSLYVPQKRAFLSLADGSYGATVCDEEHNWVAVWPDGSRLFTRATQSSVQVVRDLETGEMSECYGDFGGPIGVWPGAPVAWAGARCTFRWLYRSGGKLSALSGCEHDWPCGHEKKQYGYLDNEPCWVHLSHRGDAYLSAYQKDAIVSSAVPIRWQRCAQGWAATSLSCADPNRALFFVCEGDYSDDYPTFPNACDVRDDRPAIVLGPSAEARYALDLGRPVYRLTNTSSVLVHEPAPVYGVFDAGHTLRREGKGRLLAGWDRWLTVLDEGVLYRDDTESGERRELGPAECEVDWAFSLPGTPNVMLVQELESRLAVKLV